MADNELFREPDENTGPAVLNREPMLLPEQRKKAVEKSREQMMKLRNRVRDL